MQKEDLGKYDYILLIDKSGSMNDPVKASGGQSRWEAARELTHAVAQEAAKYDDDGITVCLFSSSYKEFVNITNGVEKVDEIFDKNSPNGGTDTAAVVNHYFQDYLIRKKKSASETKPMILICVTDGVPDDESALQRTIVDFTKKLDSEDEVGITFLQIGDNGHARDFLKRLDDELVDKRGAKFDIVDTKNADELDSLSLTDILIEAVTD